MKFKETIKKIGFGKRQIILSGLIVLIAVAGFINLNYTEIPDTDNNMEEVSVEAVPTVTTPKDEFAQLKIERDNAKSKSIDVLREIVDHDKTSPEEREIAQQQMTNAAKCMETEKMIEGLLSAKDFKETIVYISDDAVNVIVKTEGLVPTQIAQIKDIVIENTDISADNIKIVEKN